MTISFPAALRSVSMISVVDESETGWPGRPSDLGIVMEEVDSTAPAKSMRMSRNVMAPPRRATASTSAKRIGSKLRISMPMSRRLSD